MVTPALRRTWLWDGTWFLVWAVLSSLWCVTAATQLGATADEAPYVIAGMERWRTGSYAAFMGMGTMPLAADVQMLPSYLRERWKGVPYRAEEQMDHLLSRARAVSLLFWWLLLGYGWLAGRQLAGPWGGRLAVALLACETTLLAHATLATTDIAITACLLATVYHFRCAREAGWFRRVGLPTLWCAAALLAKASAVVFVPLCLLVVELERLVRERRQGDPEGTRLGLAALRPLGRDLPQILAGGFVLALLYCGSDWRPTTSLDGILGTMADGPLRRFVTWMVSLPIFSNAAEGILFQVLGNLRGCPAYLLAKVYPNGIWYYFPVALSMKLSAAVLILLLVLAVCRPQALVNWAWLAALALLALSVTHTHQLGVRIVLPLVGLGLVGLAGASVLAWRASVPGWRRKLLAAVPCATVAWMAWSSLAVWPNGLCYINELWGGTERGYLCLNDSNYDWGQGIKQLYRWQRDNRVPFLVLWKFGNDPAFRKLPMREVVLADPSVRRPEDVLSLVRGHYLAASLLHVHGPLETPAAFFLRSRRPIARTPTFFIYDFTHEPEAAERSYQDADGADRPSR